MWLPGYGDGCLPGYEYTIRRVLVHFRVAPDHGRRGICFMWYIVYSDSSEIILSSGSVEYNICSIYAGSKSVATTNISTPHYCFTKLWSKIKWSLDVRQQQKQYPYAHFTPDCLCMAIYSNVDSHILKVLLLCNAAEYGKILTIIRKGEIPKRIPTWNSETTPHTSPLRRSCGTSFQHER